jgi:hypothetical protein
MRIIRSVFFGGLTLGLMLGCLVAVSGCSDDQSPESGEAIKNAPPMTPEQKAGFDKAYKNTTKKPG